MKLLYTPFSIVFGIIGARAGKRAFDSLWDRISDEPKPSDREPDAGLARVALSAALEGATLAAAAAVANQLSVRAFHHLFGVWPVKSRRHRATASDAA
jgi:Protein of unknown function (DUF4235)